MKSHHLVDRFCFTKALMLLLLVTVVMGRLSYAQDAVEVPLVDEFVWSIASNNDEDDIVRGNCASPDKTWIYATGSIEGSSGDVVPYGDFFNIGTDPSIALNTWNSEFPMVLYGNKDGFLAKFDNDGNLQWALNFGGNNDDEGTAICVNSDGNIFITGYFTASANFGSLDNSISVQLLDKNGSSSSNIFTACYDPDGNLLWALEDGGENDDTGLAIVATETGVVVSGVLDNEDAELVVDIPGSNTHSASFLVKYSFDGDPLWFHILSSNQYSYDVVEYVESRSFGLTYYDGQIFSMGFYRGSGTTIIKWNPVDGTTTITGPAGSPGTTKFQLLSLDDNGVQVWSRVYGILDGDTYGLGLTADYNGLYMTGTLTSLSLFSGFYNSFGDIPNGIFAGMFVSKHSLATGIESSVHLISLSGSVDENYPTDMVTDGYGNYFVSFVYEASLDLDLTLDLLDILLDGSTNAGIIQFDCALNEISFDTFEGNGDEFCHDLDMPAADYLLAGGSTTTTSSTILSASLNGDENAWISKFAMVPTAAPTCCTITPQAGQIFLEAANVCPGEPTLMWAENSAGLLQWYHKYPGGNWSELNGAVDESCTWSTMNDIYVRLMAYMPGCDTVFSDSLLLNVAEFPVFPDSILLTTINCYAEIADYTIASNASGCWNFIQDIAAGSIVGTGSYQLTLTEEEQGYEFQIAIEVIEVDPPLIYTEDIIPLFANEFFCGQIITTADITPTTEDCSPVVLSFYDSAGNLLPQGQIFDVSEGDIYTIVATDSFNNSSSEDFTIHIVDNIGPTILSVDTLDVVQNEDCYYVVENFKSQFSIFDNCDLSLDAQDLIQAPMPGSMFSEDFTLFLTVYDYTGNQGQSEIYIRLNDMSPPALECPPSQNLQVGAGCQAITGDLLSLVEIYDCSEITAFTSSVSSGQAIQLGQTITANITATDEFNNTSTCSFNISAVDLIAPAVTWPIDEYISLGNTCEVAVPDYSTMMTVSETCNYAIVQSHTPGSYFQGGNNYVTISVEDDYGNEVEHVVTVVIEDNELPLIDCPSDLTIPSTTGLCGANVNFNVTSSDNCEVMSEIWVQGGLPGSFFPLGTTHQWLTVYDGYGNFTECEFNITVEDIEAPEIVCGEDIYTCDPLVFYNDPVSSDNCAFGMTPDPGNIPSGNIFPVGITPVHFIASDVAGNVSECAFNVHVYEIPSPAWTMTSNELCSSDAPLNMNAMYTGSDEHNWNGPIDINGMLDPAAMTGQTFEITLTVFNAGCSADSTQIVTVIPAPHAEIVTDTMICGQQTICQVMTDANLIIWGSEDDVDFGAQGSNLTSVSTSQFGDIQVTVSVSEDICTDRDTVMIHFYEMPVVPFAGTDKEIYDTDEVALEGEYSGAGSTTWISLDDKAQIDDVNALLTKARNLDEGENHFALVAMNGVCPQLSDSVIMTMYSRIIPNGYSPNGDGFNDCFEIKGLEELDECNLIVYDRNGNEIFRNELYSNDWCGLNSAGEPIANDTYFYELNINNLRYTGFVVVKR